MRVLQLLLIVSSLEGLLALPGPAKPYKPPSVQVSQFQNQPPEVPLGQPSEDGPPQQTPEELPGQQSGDPDGGWCRGLMSVVCEVTAEWSLDKVFDWSLNQARKTPGRLRDAAKRYFDIGQPAGDPRPGGRGRIPSGRRRPRPRPGPGRKLF